MLSIEKPDGRKREGTSRQPVRSEVVTYVAGTFCNPCVRDGAGLDPGKSGAPGGTRTPDLLVRSQTLYPTELRARGRLNIITGLRRASSERETSFSRALTRMQFNDVEEKESLNQGEELLDCEIALRTKLRLCASEPRQSRAASVRIVTTSKPAMAH